jgi:acetyltransferase
MNLDRIGLNEAPALRIAQVTGRDARHAVIIEEFYRGLSAQTRYERFFSHRPEFGPAELERLAHPERAGELCLVALAGEEGEEIAVGEVRLVPTHEGTGREGEIALVVADDWRRLGVGRKLLCGLLAAARRAGYTGAQAYITSSNTGMLSLVRQFDFRFQPLAGGATMRLVHKDLTVTATDTGCFDPAGAPHIEAAALAIAAQ